MAVIYEWAIETLDDAEDVVDIEINLHLAAFKPEDLDELHRLVLVKSVGNDAEGLQDQQHCRPCQGSLPDTFDGGDLVPARLRAQFEAWKKII